MRRCPSFVTVLSRPRVALFVAVIGALGPLGQAGSALAADDDRLVLSAPNSLGNTGLVRTTNALIDDTGVAWVGLSGRTFVTSDFVVPGVEDGTTFLDGNAVMGMALFHTLELSLQLHAGAAINSARAQPQTSVGDLALGVKGGAGFGLVAVAANARLLLPTRASKVGFDVQNGAASGSALVTLDLFELGVPVRAHINGGYTLQFAPFAGADQQKNPFFLDGADGALIAMATQSWFHDQVHGGVGVEVPLPYVTPFVELWYQTALGVDGYNFVGDAWLTATPGVRFGVGGLRVDVAADIGITGTAGGLVVDLDQVIDGQPINPAWAARVAVAHTFDFLGGGGGGGGGRFARLQGCVTAGGAPVPGAVASVTVDGTAGPRFLADDKGCFDAPVAPGALSIAVSADGYSAATVTASAGAGDVAKADAVLVASAVRGQVVGFVTNKDDESIEATIAITVNGVTDAGTRSVGGAFDVPVPAGRATIIASAAGYLSQGARVTVDPNDRRTVTFVMRKEPKKKSVTPMADRLEITGRIPFVFKTERLQSTAGYLLDEIADILIQNPALRLSIEVHTDPSEAEDPSTAKTLTERRGLVVRDALSDLGIDPERLETSGYGITQLVGPPNDPKNRRVELVLIK